MGKDIKKQVMEARQSYAFHRDSASWRHQCLFEWRPVMEQGIPRRNQGWEEPLLSQLEVGSALAMETEKREEQPVKDREAVRNGDSFHRQTPHPSFILPPSFRKRWLYLKELGRLKVRHNFTPFCSDYLGLVIARFTTGFGFFCMEICQALLCRNPF